MLRIFRHYIPKTLLLLGVAEVTVMLLSIYLGMIYDTRAFGNGGTGPNVVTTLLNPAAPIFTFVMVGAMVAMGLYHRDWRDSLTTTIVRVLLSFVVGLLVMQAIAVVRPEWLLGWGGYGVALVAAFFGIVACRLLLVQGTDNLIAKRVLVLGTGERAALIDNLRRKTDGYGIKLLGFVSVDEQPVLVPDWRVLTLHEPLADFAERQEVDEIVIALDDRRNNTTVPIEALLGCKMRGMQIIDVSSFYERQVGKISLASLRPGDLVFSDGYSAAVLKSANKRVFDIVVSTLILALTAPLMALVAIAILLESEGSGTVIYRQPRVGRNGKVFDVLKFRSMREDAEKDGVARWAQAGDNRVTRVGAFIRKTRLDELPQLYNVLKGDMSFVGPRPERPQFVQELAAQIPFYNLRHHVKPGITGWAQIRYPYGASVDDAREKLQYDLYYMKNYSTFLDLTVLVQTIQVVLWRKGGR